MFEIKELPIKGMTAAMISSEFGSRIHPITKKKEIHGGVDIRVPAGTPVRAIFDGSVQVSKIQGDGGGYGNYIVIDHGPIDSLSCHLSVRSVKVGEKVKAGQIIGYSGGAKGAIGSGSSTGPHLHFGICKGFTNLDWFDPMPYLFPVAAPDPAAEAVKIIQAKAGLTDDSVNFMVNQLSSYKFYDELMVKMATAMQ